MNPTTYRRATSLEQALAFAGEGDRLLGGGTNLVDLMRKGVERPAALVDVTGLSDTIEATADGGLLIGAATRNAAVAAHPLVRTRFSMLARATLAGASAQIRNMATVGGNVMQRTRCLYFQDEAGSRCNKRVPGSGCDAQGGFDRYHAILGTSSACIASHPSDMCVALAALDARLHLAGPAGARTLPIVDFHRLPRDRPDLEHALAPGDMIVAIEVPPAGSGARSDYRKVRDRASYAFALVSVAAELTVRDGRVDEVRIALGGIAPKPWRALRAEQALRGGAATAEAFAAAADAELAEATPPPGAAFKVELARRTMAALLVQLSGSAA
ncbi:xanthine dehydrogenase family protein subunit M [Sphingosinicella sp. BN140058]|uniref:FAD binding domain-containing protein n=1 Tax=Sphingosinicella sp. BN140058 TaxID=1892855 RepID=UPI001010C26D|nr:xanthine dehydrogenase family protein subunit M [Sphingosinicella sp. BN140058]QAY75380.1 xanthine dehydrogenase family protein subunit M [Sphingosinicella sp. BN140058]